MAVDIPPGFVGVMQNGMNPRMDWMRDNGRHGKLRLQTEEQPPAGRKR
jgi:hypothetical protein